MAFTRISNSQINSRGATTLPNQPQISAAALKEEFDAPAKQIVAPAVNNLMDELETSTSAGNLGAVAPTGRTGSTVQSVLNSLSSDLGNAEAQSHAHPNKAVIDKFADDGTGLTYDGNPVGAVTSVNSQTGAVVLTASDVGALPSTTAIPTKTSDLTNDSGFITASSLPTRTSQLTNDSGFITSGDIPAIPTKTSDLTNDSNFVSDSSYVHTDNNYDATAKGIVDGATAAIAAKSTVAWNQNITTGQKIATVTIDGTPTDVYAPTGGGGGGTGDMSHSDYDSDYSVKAAGGIKAFMTGDNTSYDNTSSGMTASNVQDAIDELNSGKEDALTAGNGISIDSLNNISANLVAGSNVTITPKTGGALEISTSGGGGGGMLPYLYIDSEAGATVTVNQPDGTTITPTAAGSGHWECELTGGYGTYVIHSVLSGQGDATQSLAVDTVKEYHVTDTHYDYTINVTAPSGSTVRIVGGGETYTGTGTGTSQAFAVHTASTTYTVAVTMDGNTKSETITSAATSGQSGSVNIAFGTINLTYANDFRGKIITCTKSGVTVTKTAPSSGNTMTFRVPTTGTWTISGTVSGTAYSVEANVTSLSTAVSADLQTTQNIIADLYSAANDTVTYTDEVGTKTCVTDANGHGTATIQLRASSSSYNVTFTSSVAKNPDNLSNDYSKTLLITSSTTSVYVMPQNAVYWYGWKLSETSNYKARSNWTNAGDALTFNNTNNAILVGGGTVNSAAHYTVFNTPVNWNRLSALKTIYNNTLGVVNFTYTGNLYVGGESWRSAGGVANSYIGATSFLGDNTTPNDIYDSSITGTSANPQIPVAVNSNVNVTINAIWCE